ncbi:hypothetical protein FN846DRAFT_1025881 [Sphaerosporella brunnea]|nr:hypothetical protein FN846DRAFT_1025881 [Sphaerosporella brunnea]
MPQAQAHSPPTEATALAALTQQLADGNNAYDPELYLARARVYLDLDYPDLAAGDAYRAVLLCDYLRDYSDEGEISLDSEEEKPSSDATPSSQSSENSEDEDEDEDEDEGPRSDLEEFHAATEALTHLRASGTPSTLLPHLEEASLHLLCLSLLRVGCSTDATHYLRLGQRRFPSSPHFPALISSLPATPSTGRARRFVYPWNHHEPDRFSAETVSYLNTHIVPRSSAAVEVRVVNLPLLSETAEVLGETKHLGVFALRDIAPGELCMAEESALTVVTDPSEGGLCEYCGSRWRAPPQRSRPMLKLPGQCAPASSQVPDTPEPQRETFTCDLCADAEAAGIEAVVPTWCSAACRDKAMAKYHPALCSRPIAPLHRAAQNKSSSITTGTQAGGTVYALLLLKTFAMALVQNTHPLSLEETRFLYGVPPVE